MYFEASPENVVSVRRDLRALRPSSVASIELTSYCKKILPETHISASCKKTPILYKN